MIKHQNPYIKEIKKINKRLERTDLTTVQIEQLKTKRNTLLVEMLFNW